MVAAFGLGTLLGAALTVGLLASLLSLVYLMGLAPRKLGEDAGVWLLVLIPAASWALWLAVFGTMLRRQHWGSVYPRLYLTLLAGSWLELLITIPIDVQVRKRTSCYCGEGTFLGLTVGLTMVLWTFGPGVALLYLARRQQRRQAAMPLNDARSL